MWLALTRWCTWKIGGTFLKTMFYGKTVAIFLTTKLRINPHPRRLPTRTFCGVVLPMAMQRMRHKLPMSPKQQEARVAIVSCFSQNLTAPYRFTLT